MTFSSFRYPISALALLALAAGCSVTTSTTTGSDTCATDSTVSCQIGVGYACTGSDTPQQDFSGLNCSEQTVQGNAGSLLYCCTSSTGTGTTTSACSADPTVTGCSNSAGYSCTGTASPEATNTALSCSSPVAGNAGSTLYCCADINFASNTCASDATVTGCQGSAIGFSCNGTTRPDSQGSGIVCSDGVAGNGNTLYCCATYAAGASTCAQDTTVQGCVDASIGFSCSGSDAPEAVDSSLVCSTGVTGNAGATLYCCNTGGTAPSSTTTTTTNSCATDTMVNCAATAGSTGYTCNGSDMPAGLTCSTGVAGTTAGTTTYCCQ